MTKLYSDSHTTLGMLHLWCDNWWIENVGGYFIAT